MNTSPASKVLAQRLKATPEMHARYALSELDFGLRGMLHLFPRILHQQPENPFTEVLHAHRSQMTGLRTALQEFAQRHGLKPASSLCEELDMLLNELRGKQVKVKYGRSLPTAIIPPLRKLWNVLLQRWTLLLETSRKFLDQRSVATVEALFEEARRMETALIDASVAQGGKTALS